MRQTTVEDLFGALRDGDRQRLDKLLPPLRVRLSRLAKQRLRGQEDVEDVVQDTLSTLWERRGTIQDPGHLLPFVFQTLRHKIGSTYLRARRQQTRAGKLGGLANIPAEPETVHAEAVLAAAEHDDMIVKAIEMCAGENPGYGRVLRHLREGKSPGEIQKALGNLKMPAVRTRICRARKRLREVLMEHFHLDM